MMKTRWTFRMKQLFLLFLCSVLLTSGFTLRAAAEEGIEDSEEEAELIEEAEEASEEVTEEEPEEIQETDAEDEEELNEAAEPVTRTVLMYLCGSDLEGESGFGTHNLEQILDSKFSSSEQVRFLVMTGGANGWSIDADERIVVEEGDPGIDADKLQVWEAFSDGAEKNAGKLVLLDQSGVQEVADKYMSNWQVLNTFINWGVEFAPAQKYDLILWDHGSGPKGGFAIDERDDNKVEMRFHEIVNAIADSKLIKEGKKFDFIDFDTCLMGSAEVFLALSHFTDYFICSPELEPGSGQDYSGWLNALGETPDMDTYALGKIIVDDFREYYQPEEGVPPKQEATLAVINTDKFMKSGVVSSLLKMNEDMMAEATKQNEKTNEFLFYDELSSITSAIAYGEEDYWDLGNLAAMIGLAAKEVTIDDVTPDEEINDVNRYTKDVQPIIDVLADPEIIYARGTMGIHSKDVFYRLPKTGEVDCEQLNTSGLFLYFPSPRSPGSVEGYQWRVFETCKHIPDGERKDFLMKYRQTALTYALIAEAGRAVSALADKDVLINEINYDRVKEYWQKSGEWNDVVKVIYATLDEGEEAALSWLKPLILQQAHEAVSDDNITSYNVRNSEGIGYEITIEQTRKRVIESVGVRLIADLPAAQDYLEKNPKIADEIKNVPDVSVYHVGTIEGEPDYSRPGDSSDESFLKHYIRWLNSTTSVWLIPQVTEKWYAVKDAEGRLHVAAAGNDGANMSVPAIVSSEEGSGHVDLIFDNGRLKQLNFQNKNGYSNIGAEQLKKDYVITPARVITKANDKKILIPISEAAFKIGPSTVANVSLVYVPITEIKDIRDIDGDGNAITRKAEVKDIYGYSYDITEPVINNPTGEKIHIQLAEVQESIYTGKDQSPAVICEKTLLKEGTDYEVTGRPDEMKNVGTYDVILTGKGMYVGSDSTSFTITKASVKSTKITGISDAEYTGKPITPKPVIQLGDVTLKEGTDYKLSYSNNVNIGTATVTIEGINNLKDSTSVSFRIVEEL
ncbi:MAG: hypothetical protein IKS32_13650, partial [Solobacterium sp.]|nr:hypothetical protein [Solobacterium sp.]